MTYDEALASAGETLATLDGLAAEEWIADSFIAEALVSNDDSGGYRVDTETLFYSLREMGERQLALDLERQLFPSS